jgi:predicted TIM-barrel fold metal-dependent hydrolase
MATTSATEPPIINCHVHTFTLNHVPSRFAPWPVSWLMKPRVGQRIGIPLIRFVTKFVGGPRMARFARFAELTLRHGEQESIFEELRSRYSDKTRFLVLPVDMTYMGRGTLRENIDEQHRQLKELRDKYPELVIPFFAVDPRAANVLDKLKRAVEQDGFRGIKLYPNLGYKPTDERLRPIWAYANEKRLPVMTHCSRGGVYGWDEAANRWVTAENAHEYTAPRLYEPILRDYPNMRLCLAHFGGESEWKRYMDNPWSTGSRQKDQPSWVRDILKMLVAGTYPNLYTDISYTIFRFQEFAPALKVFLQNASVRSRVLFGSDFFLAELEDGNEKMLSINLRAILGEDLFWPIANVNPPYFLGES